MAPSRRSKNISGWAMLLLGFLLISGAVGEVVQRPMDDYNVEIVKGVLMRVTSSNRLSDTLNLSDLCIKRIDANCFKGVKGLKSLTLKINAEENIYSEGSLPPLLFRFLPDLENLTLLNSDIQDLRYVFWGLSKLQVLDLRQSTVNLEKGSFFGLNDKTKILIDDSNGLKVEPMHFLEPYPYMSLCMIDGIVQSLELLKNTINTIRHCDWRFMPLRYEMVSLDSMGIKGFAKGWYRIDSVPVHVLTLMRNDIEHLESNLFNDLPKDLYDVYLSWNKIKKVERGKIANMNLRVLDLSGNPIVTIDTYALRDTNLTKLILSFEFMKSLPRSLKSLEFFDSQGHYAINPK